ncbi:hypothetical protein FRC18_003290 [Serendipita sp. 400]|nr:hypothetical protein FRC18_003290 [Serendipita sp. 400]
MDDADTSIIYLGVWLKTTNSDRYTSTTHHSRTMGSYAKFTFHWCVTYNHFMSLVNTGDNVDSGIEIVLGDETRVVDICRDASEYLQGSYGVPVFLVLPRIT